VDLRALARRLSPVLCVLAVASGARAERIAAVRVAGNVRAEESLIFEALGLQAGDDYQVEKIRAGVRNLYRQGLFRDIRIEGERTADGLVLTVVVRENPTLLRVRYEGADGLDEDDFAEVVELVPGQIVTQAAVEQARRDIRELYEEKGYLLAEVEADLRGEQRADLTFRVREGRKVQVKKIHFHGNESVSADDLRDVMETKEDRWWRGGDFKRALFEEDKQRIISRLGESGFLDAEVTDVQMTFDEKKEKLFLDITVAEGPRYSVGNISLDHGGVLPEDRIRHAILLAEGQPFNTVHYDETLSNLYSLFHEQGYIYARIDGERSPGDDRVVDVDYHIVENEPARIHRILIEGNTRTRDRVIRRELRAAPGDVFKRSRILRSQREVFQLGFFNDIQLDSRVADPGTGDIDLILKVEERQTGQASLGAGINSEAGLTGFLQLSQNNFRGKGQAVSVRAEFGRFRLFELSYTEPWLFGTPTSAGIDIFDTRRRYNEYTEKRRGTSLRLGRPFPWLDYTHVYWRYSLAEYRIEAEPGYEEEIGVIDPTTISSTTLTLSRNSVDSPFFPTRGSATQVSHEFGGGILGGEEHYYLGIMNTKFYLRTVGKFVWSLGGRVGILHGMRGGDAVPFWKRFRLGGIGANGLRGYDDYRIVPDPKLPSTGGRSMLILHSELRYPIVQAVQALAFFDVGNTWASPGETDLTDLRRGAGFGVRVDVPMVGQLGFDYGYGFDRTEREGGPGWEFHFQIGGMSF
jgi:outer membrane protein insertion porin family